MPHRNPVCGEFPLLKYLDAFGDDAELAYAPAMIASVMAASSGSFGMPFTNDRSIPQEIDGESLEIAEG